MERRRGFRDDVVVGGLERLVTTVGTPFADVKVLFEGYATFSTERRREVVERALDLLTPLPTRTSGKEPSARAGRDSSAAPSASDHLDRPVGEAGLVTAKQAGRKLAEMGIATYRDLLTTWPRRYEDRRALHRFGDLEAGTTATAIGTVQGRSATTSRRGMSIVRAFVRDGEGARATLVWFNQPWVESTLFPGRTIIATGKVKREGPRLDLTVAHHEIVEDDVSLSTDRIVALYRVPRGTSQEYVRRAVHDVLSRIGTVPDHLPKRILDEEGLVSLDRAVRQVHAPDDDASLADALTRLRFDEFLFLELRVLRNRSRGDDGRAVRVDPADLHAFERELPFALTAAQRRALDEILADMQAPRQMARMLQGDVGSGKTAVAAAAAWIAVRAGRQVALMAPTEILARQHFRSLRGYLHPLGVTCELLIGAHGAGERRGVRARIASGQVDLVVGTHALIQAGVTFPDLGLAIVDEEHRFGVEQRRALVRDAPDVLVMTATPIPRTLALTAYGDLDLSVIDELPPGRTPIETTLVHASKRREAYAQVWTEIQRGHQAFVVAPLVERSEAEGMEEIASAQQVRDDLAALLPSSCRIDLLHGRMPSDVKDGVMRRFLEHEVDLLVATTVVEVGVDVPNASVIVVENAERFGLAQLHQLRGRVGRGAAKSRCILVAGDRSRATQARLAVLTRTNDGFVVAEKDLELRGPGELRGTRQSGVADLELGDLVRDARTIERARDLALKILEADPDLEASWARRLRDEVKRRQEAVALRQVV